jgi:hypothetical protein
MRLVLRGVGRRDVAHHTKTCEASHKELLQSIWLPYRGLLYLLVLRPTVVT